MVNTFYMNNKLYSALKNKPSCTIDDNYRFI